MSTKLSDFGSQEPLNFVKTCFTYKLLPDKPPTSSILMDIAHYLSRQFNQMQNSISTKKENTRLLFYRGIYFQVRSFKKKRFQKIIRL